MSQKTGLVLHMWNSVCIANFAMDKYEKDIICYSGKTLIICTEDK